MKMKLENPPTSKSIRLHSLKHSKPFRLLHPLGNLQAVYIRVFTTDKTDGDMVSRAGGFGRALVPAGHCAVVSLNQGMLFHIDGDEWVIPYKELLTLSEYTALDSSVLTRPKDADA